MEAANKERRIGAAVKKLRRSKNALLRAQKAEKDFRTAQADLAWLLDAPITDPHNYSEPQGVREWLEGDGPADVSEETVEVSGEGAAESEQESGTQEQEQPVEEPQETPAPVAADADDEDFSDLPDVATDDELFPTEEPQEDTGSRKRGRKARV